MTALWESQAPDRPHGGGSCAAGLAGLVVELGLACVSKQMRRRERSEVRIGVKHTTD